MIKQAGWSTTLGKGCDPSSPSNHLHSRMLCDMFSWFWRRRFKIWCHQCILTFRLSSPWQRAWPFIWLNLNPLFPKMLCAKFGWNWPPGSGIDDENVNSLHMDEQTDNRQSEKLILELSSSELKTKQMKLSFRNKITPEIIWLKG